MCSNLAVGVLRSRAAYGWQLGLAVVACLVWYGSTAGQGLPDRKNVREPAAGMAGRESCAGECHLDIRSHKHMHGPSEGNCEACHVLGNAEQHTFFYIVPKEDLCARCHALPHGNVTHAPVRDGKCMECHDPHGSEFPKALVLDPTRDLCVKCHRNDFAESSFVHGPVAIGACIVCHEPHSSSEPSLLIKDSKALCLTCHAEIQAQGEPGLHMHAALEEGCTRCHDAHASNHKYQLLGEAPGLCLSCHQARFDQITRSSKVVHGAVMAEGGCTGCHEPHSSRLASLQRGNQPEICLDCHNVSLETADGEPIVNMVKLLADNPDHHGPIREGNCTSCHEAHAAEHFRLLKEDYPPEFYAPFNIDTFKLCFMCHQPDLVLKENGTGLTGFRNGARNLHWLHVNQQKGRTCRACHEVHASKRPAHIREAVPFGSGGWLLEINFEQNEHGGSCSPGCHSPKSYARDDAPPLPTAASK
ncbi:MAG: cytochrome c3 family protein [Phycisphaerales bacterium]|nr:cytochrome c3 family protein [Phycisphaerales bacterium]